MIKFYKKLIKFREALSKELKTMREYEILFVTEINDAVHQTAKDHVKTILQNVKHGPAFLFHLLYWHLKGHKDKQAYLLSSKPVAAQT